MASAEQPFDARAICRTAIAAITGRDLKNARASVDAQTNGPDVNFTLNPQGADKFKRATGANIGRRLAIVLDGSVASAPTIQGQIGGDGVIHGRFTTQEADELSKVLRAGALPATLRYQQHKDGLEVVGGELVINLDAHGRIVAMNGPARDGLAASPAPQLSETLARAAAGLDPDRCVLFRQGDQQMQRIHHLAAIFLCQYLALLQGVLGFLGQLVESKHMDPPETTGQADHQGHRLPPTF
jgi:hypothetical protein